jgi:hypothetical protein
VLDTQTLKDVFRIDARIIPRPAGRHWIQYGG